MDSTLNKNLPSLIKPTPPMYSLDEIKLKAKEHNWTQANMIMFLILLRMYSIEINEDYNTTNLANLSKVKDELSIVLSQIKEILVRAYDKNQWLNITQDNKRLIDKLATIQKFIKDYISSVNIFSELKSIKIEVNTSSSNSNNDNDDNDKVLQALTSMNQEDKWNIEYEILHGTICNASNLLWEKYKIKEHYIETDCHKDLIFIAYSELQRYCHHVSIIDIIFHDWTKYLLDVSIGYTWRWIHGKGSNELSVMMWNRWKQMVGDNHYSTLYDCFLQTWNKAVQFHYHCEDHHPEYYGKSNDEHRKDMNDIGLDESIVDMSARELYNVIDSTETKPMDCLKTFEYICIDTKYLMRYNVKDLKRVIEIILSVLKDNVEEGVYNDKKDYYLKFLQALTK